MRAASNSRRSIFSFISPLSNYVFYSHGDRVATRYAAGMDINRMLAELREEREGIEQAILVLQRLSAGQGKRRGRPPAWMSAMKDGTKRRGRPPGSRNKPKDELA